MANTLNQKKQMYDENRKKLYNLMEELNAKLVDDISEIDIKNDTKICYLCSYNNCNEICTKQFRTLCKNKLAYCHYHHYLLHNAKINKTLRLQNQETYNKYNGILDQFKEKYPQINLTWDRDNIWSQSELTFNCINSNCKSLVCKLFQHILQNEENINEVYFGCEECKFYISESLRDDTILLINTLYYNQLVEIPKQINYITTHSSIILKWTCSNICINCNSSHIYESSPHYRFVQWRTDCPLCLDPNKCNCVITSGGFICSCCKKYYPTKQNKNSHGNICKQCKSSANDDNLYLLFSKAIRNCIHICKKRHGDRKICDLDVEYLIALLNETNGLCYVSRYKMSLCIHSDFKISIERIDETKGYIKSNVKFICTEFQNGFLQWKPEKFDDFCKIYYSLQSISDSDKELVLNDYHNALIKNTKHMKPRKIQQKAYNNIETQECLCRSCDTIKSYESFSKYGLKNGRCISCHKLLNDKRNIPSLRLKISCLISGSKSGIERRNKSKWRIDKPLIHTLTFDELLSIYLQQFGRCAYSNQWLKLFGDYMMSLERKDTTIGYTKENCCLVCLEFNATDWSIAKCDDDTRIGSSGWNAAKVKLVVDNYLHNISR